MFLHPDGIKDVPRFVLIWKYIDFSYWSSAIALRAEVFCQEAGFCSLVTVNNSGAIILTAVNMYGKVVTCRVCG